MRPSVAPQETPLMVAAAESQDETAELLTTTHVSRT